MQTIRPASHTTALGGLFIADVWAEVQGGISEAGAFTKLVLDNWSREDVELRSKDSRGRLSPHEPSSHSHSNPYGNSRVTNLAGFVACVGYGVGIVAGEPFGVAGFEVAGHGSHGLLRRCECRDRVTATSKCGPVWWCMGTTPSGWSSNSETRIPSLTKRICLVPPGKVVEATVFVPFDISVSSGVAEGFVFEDLDGYVAEGAIGDVARYVGEGGGGEAGFAVLKLDGYGRLVFYGVD